LKAQLRQAAGDNETSTYMAVLMENAGITGLIIAPKDDNAVIDEDEGKKLAKLLSAQTTGDKRATPFVAPMGVDLHRMAFSPEEMALDKVMRFPQDRLLSAMGIDPLIVGLESSNRGSYDNREQAEKAGWNNCVLPLMGMIADDLTSQLLPEYDAVDGYCIAFDTRNVRALQANLADMLPPLVQAAGGPVLTPNEARGVLGYAKVATEGDELRSKPDPQESQSGQNGTKKPKPGGNKNED
jgi:hypothetical protein